MAHNINQTFNPYSHSPSQPLDTAYGPVSATPNHYQHHPTSNSPPVPSSSAPAPRARHPPDPAPRIDSSIPTYIHYRQSSVGRTLVDSLDHLLLTHPNPVPPHLAQKVLANFDAAIMRHLSTEVKAVCSFKAKLLTYKNVDDVWRFRLDNVEFKFRVAPELGKVGDVMMVKGDGRMTVLALSEERLREDRGEIVVKDKGKVKGRGRKKRDGGLDFNDDRI